MNRSLHKRYRVIAAVSGADRAGTDRLGDGWLENRECPPIEDRRAEVCYEIRGLMAAFLY